MSNALAAKLAKVAVPKTTPQIVPRTILVLGAALFAAWSAWNLWTVQRDTRTAEMIVAEYLFVAGLSSLVVALLARFYRPIAAPKIHGSLLDASAAIALFLSIWHLGMTQFGGYDYSAMIQAGWIQLSSLVPFKDYPCTYPPLFFLGNRYAFLIFGVQWVAFVLLGAVFAVLSLFFLSRQFRALGFPAAGATSLALTAELGTNVVCSHWCYNPMTSMVGVMVFISTLVCLASAKEWTSWTLLGVSFTLLVLSKPNAWPIGACVVLVYATWETRLRMRALTVLILGVALSGIVCWLHGLNPHALLRTYSAIAETRGNAAMMLGIKDLASVERRITYWSTGVIMLLFGGTLVASRDELLQHWREYSCCVVTAFTSLVMASTNFELKTTDLTPLVVALVVAAFRPWSKRRLEGIGLVATVMVTVVFVILSSYWGVTRLRVRESGEGMFFENVPTQTIQTGFFAGLHSGPRFITVLRQEKDVLDKYASNKVFFGPRMEFSYAAFRRDPPRGLPIWWHPGSSFPISDYLDVSRAFERGDFDLLIFLKDDYTRMPWPALPHKLSSYDKVPGFSELDVYVRKNEPYPK
jgi:hypothetical protein